MNLGSHLVQRLLRLDPPLTRDLAFERDLRVPMPDGVVLLASRWAPKAGGDGLPVALLRSLYGRGTMIAAGMARPLAERGFQVLIQSVRGAFGPGGVFEPMRNERRQPRLAVGPWTHLSTGGAPIRELLEFGLAHARGQEPPPRPPARLYVTGQDAWHDYESWPPAGYPPARYYLQAGGALTGAEPDRYRYDPAVPTPAAGATALSVECRRETCPGSISAHAARLSC
jgi:predicted acyl esterase